ncbi:hypothetical protein [Hymenobacter sp. DG25A]|uniref:hypothetical protein n=1 Tax=Hymenobacter sp. DG25A TaxID=1385663 RepID=UPI0006BCA410|nr:hypothetical protein [Hymenobacter sp. DG25A]ALD20109.1 hypothetical protein AM218_01250 [Hymenobacter sp. DG25A]
MNPFFRFLFAALLVLAGLSALPATAQLYEVRPGTTSFEKRERDAVKVQVDGTAQWTRDFWQSWLKDTYNIKLKGSGVMGVGKKDVLEARQTPISSVSGKLMDLFATVNSPSDSTSELSVFASIGPDAFLNPDKTPSEYAALRNMVQSFAVAARLKAYKDQVDQAEKQLKDSEKEKDQLNRDIKNAKANTASNLERIEALKKQNMENVLKVRQDSVKLLDNARQLELRKLQLQRRKDRLSALDRK